MAAVAAFLINKRNKDAKIQHAEELRSEAATRAQTTIAPAQQDAAEAEARAEEARVQAERAQAEAQEKQVAAQQVEAEHEAQVRDADRLDPRVDDRSDDYAPQVPGSVDQQPTPPSEANRAPEVAPAAHSGGVDHRDLRDHRGPPDLGDDHRPDCGHLLRVGDHGRRGGRLRSPAAHARRPGDAGQADREDRRGRRLVQPQGLRPPTRPDDHRYVT